MKNLNINTLAIIFLGLIVLMHNNLALAEESNTDQKEINQTLDELYAFDSTNSSSEADDDEDAAETLDSNDEANEEEATTDENADGE